MEQTVPNHNPPELKKKIKKITRNKFCGALWFFSHYHCYYCIYL